MLDTHSVGERALSRQASIALRSAKVFVTEPNLENMLLPNQSRLCCVRSDPEGDDCEKHSADGAT